MRWLAAAEGLQLRTDRQPLAFLQEENGQRLYTADKQAVLFLGEKEGRRIYQVFLGFEESSRFPKRPVLWPVWEKEPAREASLVFAFVDVASQAVLDVVRMDIGSIDRDGARSIVMRNPAGRTVKLLATSSGVLREMSETSHEDGVSPVCPTEVVPTETCVGSWLCWLGGFIACSVLCTGIGIYWSEIKRVH